MCSYQEVWIVVVALAFVAVAAVSGCKKKAVESVSCDRGSLPAGRRPARRATLRPRTFGSTSTAMPSNTSRRASFPPATSDYKYQGRLEAVVDVYTMGDQPGARRFSRKARARMRRACKLGDAGVAVCAERDVSQGSLPGAHRRLSVIA